MMWTFVSEPLRTGFVHVVLASCVVEHVGTGGRHFGASHPIPFAELKTAPAVERLSRLRCI